MLMAVFMEMSVHVLVVKDLLVSFVIISRQLVGTAVLAINRSRLDKGLNPGSGNIYTSHLTVQL